MRKLTVCVILSALLFSDACFSLPLQVEYYGVVAKSSDKGMLKMAQDTFYTQLKSIDGMEVSDKRPDISSVLSGIPDFSNSPPQKVVFYSEIEELSDGTDVIKWKCSFVAKSVKSGKQYSNQQIYDSFYKILINSKNSIEEVFQPLKSSAFADGRKTPPDEALNGKHGESINSESLAGIWSGEANADKIVLLRGGRGFIIFKNGATMNISVQTEKEENGAKVLISQVGKSNASFYPELPRETALKSAATAEPIKWEFKTQDAKTLTGTKSTLIQSKETPSLAEQGTVSSTWTKK